jgi:hypothetical protein
MSPEDECAADASVGGALEWIDEWQRSRPNAPSRHTPLRSRQLSTPDFRSKYSVLAEEAQARGLTWLTGRRQIARQ